MQQLPMELYWAAGWSTLLQQLKFITLMLQLFHFNLSLKCQNH